MSQGNIASLLIICFSILVVFGWFQSTLDRFKLKKQYVVVFLLSYFYLTSIWIQIPNMNFAINVGGTLLPIILLVWISFIFLTTLQISESVSASMLTASVLLLVHEVFPKDPKLFVIDHFITYPLLLAVTTVIIIRNKMSDKKSILTHRAIASVILSVLILDILSIFFVPRDYIGYIGDGYANDLLFLSILLVLTIYKILDVSLLSIKNIYFQKESSK